MISIRQSPLLFRAARKFGPARPPPAKTWPAFADRTQDQRRLGLVLHVRWMHDGANHQVESVDPICRLRALIGFPASKPRGPPLSVVFTHRLLITPAEGLDPPFEVARRHHRQVVDRRQNTAVSLS
jgi:hypothetical protein